MLLPDLVFEDARPLKAVDSSERMAEVRGGCLATQTTRVNPGLRPMHFTHGSNGTSTGLMSYGTGALIEPIREPEAEGMGPSTLRLWAYTPHRACHPREYLR